MLCPSRAFAVERSQDRRRVPSHLGVPAHRGVFSDSWVPAEPAADAPLYSTRVTARTLGQRVIHLLELSQQTLALQLEYGRPPFCRRVVLRHRMKPLLRRWIIRAGFSWRWISSLGTTQVAPLVMKLLPSPPVPSRQRRRSKARGLRIGSRQKSICQIARKLLCQ